LRIAQAHSLKEKRRYLQSVRTLVTRKYPVAFAEVGFQDQWQRSTIGIAAVSAQAGQLRRVLHSVETTVRNHREVEVLDAVLSYLEES
jgi:hypothetical protein